MNVGIPPPDGAPPARPPLRFEVDDQHPWLGLDAFTEELSGYFFGRTDEAEELFRRVKREPLTVLFGISGLGKTSLFVPGFSLRCARKAFCRSISGSITRPQRSPSSGKSKRR